MTKKIVIADDDPSVVLFLEKTLTKAGYRVFTAVDGLGALILIKQEKPDLIILDVMMPEVNGYDVCFEIKFDERFKHIPIILLTIRDRELDSKIGVKAGIEHIKKPASGEVLLETVRNLLAGGAKPK